MANGSYTNGVENGKAPNGAVTNGAKANGVKANGHTSEEYTAGHALAFGTRVIHAGSEANEETGAVIPPVSLSTTYKQSAVGVHKVSVAVRELSGGEQGRSAYTLV